MNAFPLLSVVTATYNRAASLPACLSSVLAISRLIPAIEHIIVDNMSSDGTEELVGEYARVAPYEVHYIREPDSGIYDALNKGIRSSRGLYIHLLHSDDAYSEPTMLGAVVHSLERGDSDVVACAIRYWQEGQTEAIVWKPSFRKRFSQCRFPHTGCIVKRAFYERHGEYDTRFRIVSDALYMANAFPAAKFEMLPVVLVNMATTGISSRDSLRLRLEQLALLVLSANLPLYYKVKRFPILLGRIVRYLFDTHFADLRPGFGRANTRKNGG